MPAQCDLTGKKVTSGNNVSHSKIKTKRTFKPNLQNVSLYSETLKQTVKLRVAVSTIRTVEHNGGIDQFLLTTSNRKLTDEAIKLKKKLKRVQEESSASKPAEKKEEVSEEKAA